MKILMTWKDPGYLFELDEVEGYKYDRTTHKWPEVTEALHRDLAAAGIGEYVTLEYDTDTKQVRVVDEGLEV